jgi:hypothetical protein
MSKPPEPSWTPALRSNVISCGRPCSSVDLLRAILSFAIHLFEGRFDQFALLVTSATPQDPYIQQCDNNGPDGETKANKPIDQEYQPSQVALENGLPPNQHARRHGQTEHAQPASQGIGGIRHDPDSTCKMTAAQVQNPVVSWNGALTMMAENSDESQPIEMPIDGVLDLHTFRPKDVKDVMTEYLAECRRKNIFQVRIIHGKGIGELQRSVHALLSNHPEVTSYSLASALYGGAGATIVHLRKTS